MNTKISLFAALLYFCFTPVSFAEIWTSSLGNCTQVYGTGGISDSARLDYNRIDILNDLNSAVIFRCLVNLRSDKAITKIQVDATADSASVVKELPADDPLMSSYLPTCRLEIKYSPGGGDHIPLTPAKLVPWGNYDKFEAINPTVQYAGNGYAQSGILQCQSPYYADVTRFYGLRITYAD